MGAKLLNESCVFQCTGNMSIAIRAKDESNNIAKESGKKILTTNAKCSAKIPLPCQFRVTPEGNLPCQVQTTTWVSYEMNKKINGHHVLTEESSISCIFGGSIKVVKPTCMGLKSSVGGNVVIEHIKRSEKSKEVNESNKDVNKSDIVENTQNDSVKGSKEKQNEEVFASDTLCDYKNCDKFKECEYLNASVIVDNNAAELRSNFQKERTSEWNDYFNKHTKMMKYANDGAKWRIAAHHLIPGNNIFLAYYKPLVKLANFFGYDINNFINCIMLPTNENDFGSKEIIDKMASANEVMGLMGRQWHVGGHEYNIPRDTYEHLKDFYKKHPEAYPSPGNPDFFSNYVTALKEELDKVYAKFSRIQCWMLNKEVKKAKFINSMNKVSREVEKSLLNFEKNPKSSFPFFVSLRAIQYAYDLPSTGKIILIYNENGRIIAKKVRVERYLKNDLNIIFNEKADIELEDLSKESNKKLFINFCENIMHFFVDISITTIFPFVLPHKRDIQLEEMKPMQYLNKINNEVIVYLQLENETYVAPTKIIIERYKEASIVYD